MRRLVVAEPRSYQIRSRPEIPDCSNVYSQGKNGVSETRICRLIADVQIPFQGRATGHVRSFDPGQSAKFDGIVPATPPRYLGSLHRIGETPPPGAQRMVGLGIRDFVVLVLNLSERSRAFGRRTLRKAYRQDLSLG